VKIGLESVNKEECLEEMVDVVAQAERITDRNSVLAEVMKREELATTGVGRGIAVPHARHKSIPALVVSIGTSSDGIKYGAMDEELVHVIFLVLTPKRMIGPHLRAMEKISRIASVEGFWQKAAAAKTPTELLELLNSED
jgi:PTS system fructose-specific IIA component/PTS system nitrogen regulatory IIA component